MRAIEQKGYELAWNSAEVIADIDLKEASKSVKDERAWAVDNADDRAIIDPEYRRKLERKNRTTQAESDEKTRLKLAQVFFENPSYATDAKLEVLPEAFKILRNREIIRTSLPILKQLDADDKAIASRKRNYANKRAFLRIIQRAETAPSKTVCKNIIIELLDKQDRFQVLITANMKHWSKNIESLNYVLVVSKLCNEHLGFKLNKQGKLITYHGFDF
ncbi:MAG: hypothetical protein H0A75_03410 [Candidatus Methanofishera endochildressiae]|uniref:Uncharacterized protein n=1 Tax=Candidatus Methanofishera endochildressiae TaxID=2738884 RepID=A0A7Z0MP44_9GAMM|nr:hypothetical protein [Candidatus Methanofishera endochildressiae]